MNRCAGLLLAGLLLFVAVAPDAAALNTGDTTIVVPIVGRFPGALGTLWRTDLFIGNRTSVAKTITMTFYVAGGTAVVRSVEMPAYAVTTLRDVVLTPFGLENASGQLILTTNDASGFEARVRIYNAGSAVGEFGQSAPGIGLSRLRNQAYVYGVSGIGGNRVNSGVANPNDRTVDVAMVVIDASNAVLGSRSLTLGPRQTIQVNDVFASFGIAAREGIQIVYSTIDPNDVIYGYASEVRNDSNDAIFIFGTSPNTGG
jgi:hypothetical protein